jgi:hypothetical protein
MRMCGGREVNSGFDESVAGHRKRTSETDIGDLELAGSESAEEVDDLSEELTGAQSIITRHGDDRARAVLKGVGKKSAERAN